MMSPASLPEMSMQLKHLRKNLAGESASATVKLATIKSKLCFKPKPPVKPKHTAIVIPKVTARCQVFTRQA